MSPNETIDSVKKVIENELNIPTIQQRLMYKGKPLAGWLFNILIKKYFRLNTCLNLDTSIIRDCNIQPGSKIHLSLKNVEADNSKKAFNQSDKASSSKSIVNDDCLLNKELKNGLKYFNDDINVNEFVEVFNNVIY